MDAAVTGARARNIRLAASSPTRYSGDGGVRFMDEQDIYHTKKSKRVLRSRDARRTVRQAVVNIGTLACAIDSK